MSPLLTAKDVSRLLSVNLSTVYAWVDQGYLPHVVLAKGSRRRCIRFRGEALGEWLDMRSCEGRVDRVPPMADNAGALAQLPS
jgi:excisionase family DNA binding protein